MKVSDSFSVKRYQTPASQSGVSGVSDVSVRLRRLRRRRCIRRVGEAMTTMVGLPTDDPGQEDFGQALAKGQLQCTANALGVLTIGKSTDLWSSYTIHVSPKSFHQVK